MIVASGFRLEMEFGGKGPTDIRVEELELRIFFFFFWGGGGG